MTFDSIPRRLLEQARLRPSETAYCTRIGSRWAPATWAEYTAETRRVAKALMALGLRRGGSVSILGFNRPEWSMFALGCMAAGGAPAGVYTTCSASEVRYIVDHSESFVLLVDGPMQWNKIAPELAAMPLLRHVVMMKGAPSIDHPKLLSWEQFLAKGDAVADRAVDESVDALEPDQLAAFIYTSGTTGPPKGVMLSHQNIAWTAAAGHRSVPTTASDSVLSYLPLSHIAEQVVTIYTSVLNGYAVYYAESIEKVLDNLREVQPTVFFSVPRIWEKIKAGVTAKLDELREPQRTIVTLARRLSTHVSSLRNEGKHPTRSAALAHRLAQRVVFAKMKQALGLGAARVCVVGAAPIDKEVLEFFASIDITIHEIYGQAEDCGPTSVNVPGCTRFGTVGRIVDGLDVRIADDGEILVRGPNVFLGYFKDPAATAQTLVDGWLHSGDLGVIDGDGFLHITGRKKDIIITAGGKNITPRNIEEGIKRSPLVAEAVVIGDRRKYLTALVTLEADAAQRFALEHGLGGGPVHEHAEIEREIQKTVDLVNQDLARVEQIKRFRILARPFAIDTGELTPTLKVKRNVVSDRYSDVIESMYAE